MENNNNTGKTADVASARNRINRLFAERGDRKLLSIYFCAGCPTLEGTADVILTLQRRGIDMIEVGIPFSDPLADGPVIQSAGTTALRNGITLQHIFQQLKDIKPMVTIPLVLMGYLNISSSFATKKISTYTVSRAAAIVYTYPIQNVVVKSEPSTKIPTFATKIITPAIIAFITFLSIFNSPTPHT